MKIAGSTIFYKHYRDKGVHYINDLVDENGKFYSYSSFKSTYNINMNFIEYLGIIYTLQLYLKKQSINIKSKLPAPIMPYFINDLIKQQKGCRTYYDTLNTKTSSIKTNKNVIKGETILPCTFTEEEWKTIHTIPFRTNTDSKLQWFQYSIIFRILPTNELLYKMKLKDNNECDFCHKDIESLTHLFFDCDKVKAIWTDLSKLILNKTGVKLKLTKEKILLGYLEKRNNVLNLIINTTKYSIFKCKLRKTLPHFKYIKNELQFTYEIDRYIAFTKCNYSDFYKYWSICHLLFA